MNTTTAQDVQDYLETHNYMTLEGLAERAGTTPSQIRALEDAQCIPAASYVLGGEVTFTSSFGTYALPVAPQRYYHPTILRWVMKAMDLARSLSLADAARIVRANFDKEFNEALNGAEPPWPRGADYAWDFMTDGTWGLCLKNVTAADLLTKERARAVIRRIVQPESDHILTHEERAELETALRNFEKVALPFSPHEVADSSRHKEIRPAVEKYGINVEEIPPATDNRRSQFSD
jgi:hypothetical protein